MRVWNIFQHAVQPSILLDHHGRFSLQLLTKAGLLDVPAWYVAGKVANDQSGIDYRKFSDEESPSLLSSVQPRATYLVDYLIQPRLADVQCFRCIVSLVHYCSLVLSMCCITGSVAHACSKLWHCRGAAVRGVPAGALCGDQALPGLQEARQPGELPEKPIFDDGTL